MTKTTYPDWICANCGDAYGRGMPKGHLSTWHEGQCDICKGMAPVTEPRDYGHLKEGWKRAARI